MLRECPGVCEGLETATLVCVECHHVEVIKICGGIFEGNVEGKPCPKCSRGIMAPEKRGQINKEPCPL